MEHNKSSTINYTEKNHELLIEYKKSSSQKVLEKIISLNDNLVTKIALGYLNRCSSLVLDDLKVIGTMGLIEAVDNFNFDYNTRFSTYAAYHIKGKILHDIYIEDSIIRLPKEKEQAILKFYHYMNSEHLDFDQACEKIGMSKEDIDALINISTSPVSLDFKVNEETDSVVSLHELIQDENAENAGETVILSENIEALAKAITVLNERETICIMYRYGFDKGTIKTYKEIAPTLHISAEAVRQMEQRALKKLHKIMEAVAY